VDDRMREVHTVIHPIEILRQVQSGVCIVDIEVALFR
jgi:hypothetical protein